ncbi:DUF7673 family protein [Pseudoxanthomonas indica]|uniref:DUF7673 domain-containing protein n=1 Tax=Pseudoxanthomonas indica TaxID=428993 RepID=A0A1T5JGC4_9GAMM|nr:hypothetical protein [Pseudoxanthomonas indica]GGD58516.1 hypothetical protein GCM10007235_33580 [Pseudoxanthomonas indica]SKC50435.1 hypothetical protein SAMN06296058_0779 [Pseudoxanthomonas indica]
MDRKEADAMERLIDIANQDTGQSSRVANFLLAWWNADSCGGFDLTDLWVVDQAIRSDMLTTLGLILKSHSYPDTLGYGAQFEKLISPWRPDLPVG